MWYFPVKGDEEHLTDAGTQVSCDEGTLTIDRYCKDSGVLHTTDSGMGEGNTLTHSKAQLHFQSLSFKCIDLIRGKVIILEFDSSEKKITRYINVRQGG